VFLRTITVASICAATITGCVATSDNSRASSRSSEAAAATAKIGTPVSDGKFQFVVTSVDRSPTAGDPADPTQAKGEFFNVHLTVKNTGTQANSYGSHDQKLIVAGKQFDAAEVLGLPGDDENINPGLSIDTVVPFDVPPGTQPDAVQLHDSAFSNGVTVSLK
jgi:hypothetical protein